CVGRSNATLRPVTPCDSKYRYRRLESAAVANPAYWRMVHGRPRYIVGWIPLVKGNRPGRPMSRSGSHAARSAAVRNRRGGAGSLISLAIVSLPPDGGA